MTVTSVRRGSSAAALIPALAALALCPGIAAADWPANPGVNVAVCDTAGDQTYPKLLADGAGGVYCAWDDTRRGVHDLRLLRLDRTGSLAAGWPAAGLIACPDMSSSPTEVLLLPSELGTLIACWKNIQTDYAVHAQRYDTSGAAQWGPQGILVPARIGGVSELSGGVALPDGGAMIFWRLDYGFGVDTTLAMRIDRNGNRVWIADLVFNDAPGRQDNLIATLVSDTEVVATWIDRRTTPNPFEPQAFELYGQKLGISGTELWGHNGVRILTEGWFGQIMSNGRGGFAGAYISYESDQAGDLKLANVGRDGAPLAGWPANGFVVSARPGVAEAPAAVSLSPSDGSVMVEWWDAFAGDDIRIQKVDTTGVPQFPAGGRIAFHPTASAAGQSAVADGRGGLFIDVQVPDGSEADVFAQHVRSDGALLWPATGVPVSTAPGRQYAAQMTPDSSGGVFLAWLDYRNLSYEADIYAQHVNADGSLGGDVTATEASAVSADYLDGCARVRWYASDAAGVVFAVQRRELDASWVTLGQSLVDGSDQVEYRDCEVVSGATYAYRLEWSAEGQKRHTAPISLTIASSPLLALAPPAPNPIERHATLEYTLPVTGWVRLEVLDLAGRRVATLARGREEAGVHRVDWTAQDAAGRPLPAGGYLLRLESGGPAQMKRFFIVR